MGICISNSKNKTQLVKIINSHNILEIRLNIIYENYIWNRFTGWNTYQSEEMLYREAIAYIIQYSKKNNIYILLNLLYLEYLKKYLLDNNIILPSNIIIK
jgi:hypothetical protein